MSLKLSNTADVDDAALVARAQAGERQAFSTLVRRHQATVYRVCYRMLGDREDAEDATQETFVRAYQKLQTFQAHSAFKTWLVRLTVNVSLNERARRKRRRDLDGAAAAHPASPVLAPGPEGVVLQAETVAQVHQALQLLKPEHRAAVILRDLEGLSYAAVAAALAVPEGTAKGWAHRGRERLKELLTCG